LSFCGDLKVGCYPGNESKSQIIYKKNENVCKKLSGSSDEGNNWTLRSK
jgi:hypothetical protein